MGVLPGFVNGSNLLSPQIADGERTINLYVETISPPGAGHAQKQLKATEGLSPFAQVLDTDTRGLFYLDGRAFAVTGTTFSEVFQDGTTIAWGTVAYDGTPATFCSNGTANAARYVMLTAGGSGYTFNTASNTFAQIADPDFPVASTMCEFFGGFFWVLPTNERYIQWSATEDPTTWDVLDTFERTYGADNIAFMKRNHQELWIVGTQTGETLYLTGGTALIAPVSGVFMEHGCVAPFSALRVNEELAWLDQNERGGGTVVISNGYRPESVSSYAINLQISAAESHLQSAHAMATRRDGHVFYWLYVPTLSTTPVFDFTERVWCERATWDPTSATFEPHVARCHMWAFEKSYVGVADSGIIYELSPTTYDDDIS